MHSRIFCMTHSYDEQGIEELLEDTNEDLMLDLMGSDADYVVDSDKDSDMEWLLTHYSHIFIYDKDTNCVRINKDGVRDYVDHRFEQIKELTKSLTTTTGYLNNKYKLELLLNETTGFYVYEPNSLWTMNEFLENLYRRTAEQLDNLEYILVKTFDYHW